MIIKTLNQEGRHAVIGVLDTGEIIHEINLYQYHNEWNINWSAYGSVTINKANDFYKVLSEAIKLCANLNTK